MFVKEVGGMELVTDGLNVGSIEGNRVGTEEAGTVGIGVGDVEFVTDGLNVGALEGNCVGTAETLVYDGFLEIDGDLVGTWVGSFVRVGIDDG